MVLVLRCGLDLGYFHDMRSCAGIYILIRVPSDTEHYRSYDTYTSLRAGVSLWPLYGPLRLSLGNTLI